MIHALMLAASGLAMLAWRPCRDAQGRAPRTAIAMLLAGAAGLWVGSFGVLVGVVTGELGSPLAACGVLLRHLVAGDLGWWRLVVVAAWTVALPLRAGVAMGAALLTTARVRRRFRALGTPLDGQAHVVGLPGLGTTAVTVGLLRPIIAVDATFWATATPLQREVVLAHEHAHRRGRHSIVELAARCLTAPLPGTTAVYDCIRRHLEALADDAAVRRHDPLTVGVALGRVALAAYPAGGLGASGAAVWRVQRLVQPSPRVPWRDRLVLVSSSLALAVGLIVVTADAAAALGRVANPTFCPL